MRKSVAISVIAVVVVVVVIVSAWGLGWYPPHAQKGTSSGTSPPITTSGTPSVFSAVAFADSSSQPTTSPPFASAQGDAVFAWITLYGGTTVASVTDNLGEVYSSIASSNPTGGPSGNSTGISVWGTTNGAGGRAVTVTITLAAGCTTCLIHSAVVLVDVTGVSASPILGVGAFGTSSALPNGESSNFTSSVVAGWGDFVLAGVAAGSLESFTAGGNATLVDQEANSAGGPNASVTEGILVTNGGDRLGSVVVSGTGNQSSAWVAGALALSPRVPPPPPPVYPVVFFENGLPFGAAWSVTLAGQGLSGTSPNHITFSELDGRYSYGVTAVAGYTQSSGSGSVSVEGGSVTVLTNFTAVSDNSTPNVTPIQHVVVILMENQELPSLLQNASYFGYLLSTYSDASRFYAECHGSLPDYLAMTNGRALNGCGNSNLTASPVSNIPDLLQNSGYTWGAYLEGMPTACDRSSTGTYLVKHNPFLLYSDIVNNATRCDSHVVNSAVFNSSVASGNLPNVSWYIPTPTNDCYTGNVAYCSEWLQAFLGSILNSSSPAVRALVAHTAFVITFDEGTTNHGYSIGGIVNPWCYQTTGSTLTDCGGHTYLTVVSPYSVGTTYTGLATDYSLASTIEWLFGLGSDGGFDGTPNFPAMSGLFSFATNR